MLTDDDFSFLGWFLELPTIKRLALLRFVESQDSRLLLFFTPESFIVGECSQHIREFIRAAFGTAINLKKPLQAGRQVANSYSSFGVFTQTAQPIS